jgi:hypothetical protein
LGIAREAERKGSASHLLWWPVEVYVSTKILRVLKRIFKTYVKGNIKDFEFFGR